MIDGLIGSVYKCIYSKKFTAIVAGLFCVTQPSCIQLTRAIKSDVQKVTDKLSKPGELDSDQYALDDSSPQRGGLTSLMEGSKVVARVGQLTTSEEDIVWAPEDPDAPIVELEGIAVADEPVDSWYEDYDEAMRKARITGKPVMMWFTRSKNSPLCNVLSRELLATREFDEWAGQNVIRLRIDSNIKERDTGKRRDKEREIAALKKRYSASGTPAMVMLSPRGTEFGKYRGYDPGEPDFYFGRLKNSQRVAQEDHASWKSDMERKGYRLWHDARGRTVYAKVLRYKDGTIWLGEPDGKKSKTKVSKLSTEDKLYIERRIEESRAKKTGI